MTTKQLLRSIAVSLILAGCAPGISNIEPGVQSPDAFTGSGVEAVSDRWWEAFSDGQVDRFVATALDSNFSLEATWHRLRAAKARVDRESASFFPDLTGTATGEIERGASVGESLRLGLASDYELDLWGKIRSQVAAERFRFRASHADYQAAALTLTAEVVRTWYQLMDARSRLDLFESQIETNTQVLGLIRARFGSGQVRSVDIMRQEQLIESTREQKINAQSRVKVLEHQLAVLLGQPPQQRIAYQAMDLPAPPPIPTTGLPAELIQRRPDVRESFNLLRAADRDLAVAITNRYPRLTLSASTSSRNDGDGFEDWARNITAGLFAPIFNAGERGAEVRRNRALKDERLYAYGQTILTAFREVEDALVQEQKQAERIKSIEAQVELARRTYDQLRLEYLNGITDYLNVLTALTAEQRLRRDLISAKLVLLEHRISLYRALAGGFDTGREESLDISLNNQQAG